MDEQAGPKNYVKDLLSDFVVKYPLPGNSTRSAPEDSHHMQNLFGYAPALPFGLEFIKAIKTKGNDVYRGQISQVDRNLQE